ncbi:mechanosensitive ion channel [Pontibacterium granulatum]|uniref:mechanosensitive ion channel family protein n=1 Tax=Pontibacterium granulatum TaxID=2036029 RepID=UPI00249A74E9|nr:mechanosensitive ion channel domain-containing protein [Pontibacterium granulatum]MDI3323854.1 mechanosensitive ion channel [Pontibacterium granulatum]
MSVENVMTQFDQLARVLLSWLNSPGFYSQLALVVLAIVVAYGLGSVIRKRSAIFSAEPAPGPLVGLRGWLFSARPLLFPLLLIVVLALTVDASEHLFAESQLVKVSQSAAVVFLLYSVITHFVHNKLFKTLIVWILIPASVLHIFNWLDVVTTYLDEIAITAGNIKISAYGILRMLVFGSLLFWLGRLFRTAGNRIIRKQEELDIGTRELFAKLFEVVLAIVIFVLLLQLMGINLTALAVFGGALGVGLGFGLQSIASNFISGIILLLDRSLTVGDYIELEDGKTGTIRELNMRSTTLETYDGKDIMVPNERFMSSTFVNWTHKNKKQRYSIEFQVAYSTDLEMLFPLLREVVAEHPKVLSGDDIPIEERPDAEIKQFGESGIDLLIEFWMEGIDDGENRVGGDLLLMIWYALKEHNVEIPFPQREVTIVGEKS